MTTSNMTLQLIPVAQLPNEFATREFFEIAQCMSMKTFVTDSDDQNEVLEKSLEAGLGASQIIYTGIETRCVQRCDIYIESNEIRMAHENSMEGPCRGS